jgi:DNA (cytosine-5)-methyltransferase 1
MPTAERQRIASFSRQLSSLGVVTDDAGWPDSFGRALQRALADAERVKTLSLFAGGGGLDLGFHDAGFDIVEAVELEAKYAATLERNARGGRQLEGTTVRCLDVRKYKPPVGLEVDFIIGGPPCQTFSAAGRRASGVRGTDDERGTLFEEYARLLQTLEPAGFLFENVYGILWADGGRAWEEIRAAFEQIGYRLSWRILDVADYGVPQHRERLFIVGARDVDYRFPRPSHGPDSADEAPFYVSGTAVKGVASQGEALQTVNGRYGHLLEEIPPGLNYSYFTDVMGHPEPVFAWRSKFSDFLYKADPQRPVRTIKAQGGQYTGPFHWDGRPFSVAELKRLQTFPDDYELTGGRQVAIEQIGNSVPPQLARVLALAVREQVFSLSGPVELESLDPDEPLWFRQRKRALTAHYRSLAATAIARREERVKQEMPGYPRRRVLTKTFGWLEDSGAKGIAYKVDVTDSGRRLDLIVSNVAGVESAVSALEIKVTGSPAVPWPLGIDEARLRSSDPSGDALTALWKAFEEVVRERWHLADLVQLSGYYQYEPQMLGTIVTRLQDGPLWTAIEQVTAGNMVGVTAPASEFIAAWGMRKGEIQLPSLLRRLRRLGYEPRSHRTNPQIPRGFYLIPYGFPTLTPESVQLRKRL